MFASLLFRRFVLHGWVVLGVCYISAGVETAATRSRTHRSGASIDQVLGYRTVGKASSSLVSVDGGNGAVGISCHYHDFDVKV